MIVHLTRQKLVKNLVEQSPLENFNQVKARHKLELSARPWQTPSHPCLFHMRDFRDNQVCFGSHTTSRHIEDISHKKSYCALLRVVERQQELRHTVGIYSAKMPCLWFSKRVGLDFRRPTKPISNTPFQFVIFYSMRRKKNSP